MNCEKEVECDRKAGGKRILLAKGDRLDFNRAQGDGPLRGFEARKVLCPAGPAAHGVVSSVCDIHSSLYKSLPM